MTDRERVIYDIERCICRVPDACRDCSKYKDEYTPDCMEQLLGEALELLKEHGPVVRCNDCKHYAVEDHLGNFHGYKILAASDVPTCHRWANDVCMVKPDGYCFLAERR